MGAITDAILRYAEPLLDATDGSPEQIQKALTLSQMCWNLAISPKDTREEFLVSMQPALGMGDDEFEEFQRTVAKPMIRRHHEMFPALQRPEGANPADRGPGLAAPWPAIRRSVKKYAGTGRNERCPCGSGKKYKVCCGR
jgi:uncharacterized protein YecA (UPF0149 family)